MDFERRHRMLQEINLTALIDIVFHLMVFVMLTTTFVVSESMELSLPSDKVSSATAPSKPLNIMRIQILSDGSVIVDNRPMNLDLMNAALSDRVAADADVKISLLTGPGSSVQQLITVMDAVYLNGGRNVQVDKAG